MNELSDGLKKIIRQRYLIIIIFLWLAFALRVWGLDFGLPYKFHPDEDKYVDVALAWHTSGQLDLELINPPLFTYTLLAADWFWLALNPFAATETWLTGAYFFARLWSVGLSMLTVCLGYATAKQVAGKKAGLVALILLSGAFLPAREAHFAVNDSAVTLMVLITLYFCLRLYHSSRTIDYLLVGLSLGLAAATKLTGGMVLVSVLLTFALLKKRNYFLMMASFGLAALIFLLVSLHIFWQLPQFIEAINDHLRFGAEGYKGLQMTPGNGWLFYSSVLGWGLGWVMLATFIPALVRIMIRPVPARLILAIFPVALFVYMGAQKIVFARFLLPVVPALVILTAIFLADLAPRWGEWRQHALPVWGVILTLLLAQPIITAVRLDYLLTLPDTRRLATDWFMAQFPAGTKVVRENYSVLPNTVFVDKKWPYKANGIGPNSRLKADTNYYETLDADLIVISNFTSGRIFEDPSDEKLHLSQMDYLNRNLVLLKEFNPYQAGYHGRFYLDELYAPAGEIFQRSLPGPLIKIYAKPCAITGNGCAKLPIK